MRAEFITELVRLAERDPSVLLLTGDLGFGVVDSFAERHPQRFVNVGVAEQNMFGIATGLAEAGFRPYVYSIATFATLRPYEFIRNGPLLHDLPIRIVGVGTGFDYGHNGVTHFALEDVAVMRAQPRMTVVAPGDSVQARAAVVETANVSSPVYYRLSKSGGDIPELGSFRLGRLAIAREGTDIALVALGGMAREALDAARLLAGQGIEASVGVVTSFNPDPVEDLIDLLERVPVAVAIEDHYVTGGLGSLVAEIIAETPLSCRLSRCGVRTMPTGHTGDTHWLRGEHGLTADAIAEVAMRALVASVG